MKQWLDINDDLFKELSFFLNILIWSDYISEDFFFLFSLWVLRYALLLISEAADLIVNRDHSLLKFLWFPFCSKLVVFLETHFLLQSLLEFCYLVVSVEVIILVILPLSGAWTGPLMQMVISHCQLIGAQVRTLR